MESDGTLRRLERFKPQPATAYSLVIAMTLIWAAGAVIARGVHEFVPPVGLSFWRWAIGALVVMPLVAKEVARKLPLISENIGIILWLSILQVGASTLFVVSLTFTTAINATLINAVLPVTTVLAAWILVHDRINLAQAIGVALALGGVLVMVVRADWRMLATLDFNFGDVIAFTAIIGWAVYAVDLRRLPSDLGLMTSLFLIAALGSVMLVPFYVAESIFYMPVPVSGTMIGISIYLGIFATVIGIYIWNAGVRAVGPTRAAIFIYFIPVFGTILAIIFLSERLFAFHVIGAALVCIGIAMVLRLGPRPIDVNQ